VTCHKGLDSAHTKAVHHDSGSTSHSPQRRLVLIENQVAMVIVDSEHETCSPALEVSDNRY